MAEPMRTPPGGPSSSTTAVHQTKTATAFPASIADARLTESATLYLDVDFSERLLAARIRDLSSRLRYIVAGLFSAPVDVYDAIFCFLSADTLSRDDSRFARSKVVELRDLARRLAHWSTGYDIRHIQEQEIPTDAAAFASVLNPVVETYGGAVSRDGFGFTIVFHISPRAASLQPNIARAKQHE